MPKSIKKLYNAWGQKMKQILNEQKGVTLIALVITIIVLLIHFSSYFPQNLANLKDTYRFF